MSYSVHQNLDGIGEENEPMETEVLLFDAVWLGQ